MIAKRANCSTGHVRKVREELERDGKLRKGRLASPPPKPSGTVPEREVPLHLPNHASSA